MESLPRRVPDSVYAYFCTSIVTDPKTNVSIAYRTHGSGPIKVVLINGIFTSAYNWYLFLKGVYESASVNAEDLFTFLTLDNRGTGSSSSPFGRYTTEMMASDVKRVIDQLKWPKVHVMGISMGGMIAQCYAAMYPETLLSLTLLATTAANTGSTFQGIKHFVYIQLKPNPDDKLASVLDMLYGSKVRNDPAKWAEVHAFHKDLVEKRTRRVLPMITYSGMVGQLAAVFTHRMRSEQLSAIAALQIPKLVVTGNEDKLIDPRNSVELSTQIKAQMHTLKGHGHGLLNLYEDLLPLVLPVWTA